MRTPVMKLCGADARPAPLGIEKRQRHDPPEIRVIQPDEISGPRIGRGKAEGNTFVQARRITLAGEVGSRQALVCPPLLDLQPDELSRRFEFSVGPDSLQAKLERVGAAVDLAVAEDEAGFDAQADGGYAAAIHNAVAHARGH